MTAWWLSFAGDEGFRGGCIVEGFDIVSASLQARMLGINPGGQVVGMELPPEAYREAKKWAGRLLSREEIAQMDAELCEMS